MKGKRGAPWVAELVVIVVGVLVALAVDDLAQGRADRELEAHLLQRLSEDLVADASDLALAQVHVARRQWLFGELARVLDEGGPPSPPPDSILKMRRHGALLEAAGRLDEADWARSWDDSFDRPLFALRGSPDFDLSDDSYREMLEAGALRTLRDHDLRSAIMAYYRTAEDDAANVMNVDPVSSSGRGPRRSCATGPIQVGQSGVLLEPY